MSSADALMILLSQQLRVFRFPWWLQFIFSKCHTSQLHLISCAQLPLFLPSSLLLPIFMFCHLLVLVFCATIFCFLCHLLEIPETFKFTHTLSHINGEKNSVQTVKFWQLENLKTWCHGELWAALITGSAASSASKTNFIFFFGFCTPGISKCLTDF